MRGQRKQRMVLAGLLFSARSGTHHRLCRIALATSANPAPRSPWVM